jgi:hypothetical protein
MDDPFVVLQSERSQLRTRGSVIRVKNASNPQTFRSLDEHRDVFEIDYLSGWRLRNRDVAAIFCTSQASLPDEFRG